MNGVKEDRLGRALREEGRGMGPGFSALLHERVMRGLSECGMEMAPARVRRNWVLRIGVPAGIAAGLAIAVGTWMHVHQGASTPAPARIVEKPADADEAIAQSTESADETLEKGRYAYLDKDAQRFVSFVADQVPSFPSDAQ